MMNPIVSLYRWLRRLREYSDTISLTIKSADTFYLVEAESIEMDTVEGGIEDPHITIDARSVKEYTPVTEFQDD